MREFFRMFFKEEDGIETIEFLGMIVVAVALVVVIAGVAKQVKGKADSETGGALNNLDYDSIAGQVGVPAK